MKMEEKTPNKKEIIRSLKPGDEPLVITDSPAEENHIFATLLWSYNKEEGPKENKHVYALYDNFDDICTLFCVTHEEFLRYEAEGKVPAEIIDHRKKSS